MQRIAEAALLTFVALMGIEQPPVPLPGHAEWADLAMLVAVAALILSWRARLRWPLTLGPTLAAGGYVAWTALSAATRGAGGWAALGTAELFGVFVTTAAIASDPAPRERLLRVWLWASAGLGLAALVGAALAVAHVPSVLYDSRGGDLNLPFRARGLCTTMNLLASQLLVPLVLVVTEGRRLLGPRRRWVVLALIAPAFAVTLSRTWFAAALAACLLTTRGWARTAGVGLLVVVSLAVMRFDLYRSADGRVTFSTAPGIRWRLARSALKTAIDHPVVGAGPSALPARVEWPRPGDPPMDMRAHSTPIDVAATRGLPALAAFALLCALLLRDCLRAPHDPLRLVLACSFGALLFDGLTVDLENCRHLWLLFGLVAGSRRPERV